ncbi:unnamed protein product [Caenorhabditis bovis]|uniref:Peptidase A2 domain-containing protein n=1 Tax=Caenorhabditis bovis TaxID=2654633 RepID=A0A8S1F4U0_9PELO|nr:unnamed protein product [Caenorhabditis bovis]
MGDNKDTAMLQMMKLLQEQMELTRIQAEEGRKQTAKFAELVERLSGNAQQSTKLEKVEVSEASIIASLAERIPTFDFNLEDNRTFPKWYNRYSEMLKGLSEDGKRQLLLEKLSEPCYEQLVAALRPKSCIELSFEELTETLSNIFDIKRSLFAYRKFLPVRVKGQWIDFQVDTGADITLIGRVEWEKLGKPTLETADAKVICANGSTMEIDGRFHTDFELKGSTGQGWIYVRKEGNLLGLDFINQSEHMAYHMERMVSQVESVKKDRAKELQTRFPSVFQEELGTCVKEKAHLEVKEGDEDIVIAEVKVLNVDYLAEGEATATDKVLKTVIKYWKSNNWPRRNPVNDLCTNQSSSSSDNDNTHSPPDKPKSNEHPNQKSCHGQSQPSSSKHRHSQIPVAIAKESAGSTRPPEDSRSMSNVCDALGSQRTVCVKPKIEPNTQAGPEDRAKDKSGYDAVQEFGNPSYDLIPVHNEDPTYISQQP